MDELAEAAANLAIEAQLLLLFGENSKYAGGASRTPQEWRQTLRAVVAELKRYMDANVETDVSHWATLRCGLEEARCALDRKDFWPGYCAGPTHIAIALLGHFPDHSRNKPGKRKEDRYRLNHYRSVTWSQTSGQRKNTLLSPADFGAPTTPVPPRERYSEFGREFGSRASSRDFLDWYRKKYPSEYTQFF